MKLFSKSNLTTILFVALTACEFDGYTFSDDSDSTDSNSDTASTSDTPTTTDTTTTTSNGQADTGTEPPMATDTGSSTVDTNTVTDSETTSLTEIIIIDQIIDQTSSDDPDDTTTGADTASDSGEMSSDSTSDAFGGCIETNGGMETCDNLDNNCDGNVDEIFDLQHNAQHCGGCKNDCLTNPELWPEFGEELPAFMESVTCNSGHCQVANCQPGHRDDPVFPYPDCNFFIKQLVLGGGHSCVLFSDDSIKCWGDNRLGALGANTEDKENNISMTPVKVEGLIIPAGESIIKIATGSNHVCVLLSDQSIQCWGDNFGGQLGRATGDDDHTCIPAPVDGLVLPEGITISDIVTGQVHTCALLSDNSVHCWGSNLYGQLGRATDNSHNEIAAPVEGLVMPQGTTISKLVTGNLHMCVLLSNNTIQCWGNNSNGQLGRFTGIENESQVPAPVVGLRLEAGDTVMMLTAATTHTCALISNNTVQCWGSNMYGCLGRDTGSEYNDIEPGMVEGLEIPPEEQILALESGDGFNCAVFSDDSVHCWGRNNYGQLGRLDDTSEPAPIQGLSFSESDMTISQFRAGTNHSCVLFSYGDVYCWGSNQYSGAGGYFINGGDFSHIPKIVDNLY